MMENMKILILILPMHGHTNPVLGLANELAKRKANLIFYSNNEFKDRIEKTGAQFREYSNFIMDKNLYGLSMIKKLMDISANMLLDLVRAVENDKPDLIIYDVGSLHAQYLLLYLKNKYETGKHNFPPPPAIFFSSTFAFEDKLWPEPDLVAKFVGFQNVDFGAPVAELIEMQKEINIKYGLSVEDPMKLFIRNEERLKIVSVFPELQPNSKKYNDTYKFVGVCLSEARKLPITNDKLKSLLSLFNDVNPIECLEQIDDHNDDKLKLIYVSLGTVYNNNLSLFETIINGLTTFDEEQEDSKSEFKFSQLRIIVSLGDMVYKTFQNKIMQENFQLPDNMLLLPMVPQLEVLKRASVFITHCGMNSTGEAINYAVPVVGIPLSGDQPYVAYRICDELKLGIRLNTLDIKSEEIRASTHEILRNILYQENMIKMSQVSRGYNGTVNAVKYVEEFIQAQN